MVGELEGEPLYISSQIDCSRHVHSFLHIHTLIKNVVILITFTDEEILQKLTNIRVLQLVFDVQCTNVVEENTKLIVEATAKLVGVVIFSIMQLYFGFLVVA
jgi:hypothetical protein